MEYQLYVEQLARWPVEGQHIMSNFDEETISVYQAYKPSIAGYACQHQKFGSDFSFNRMSWIKPNFLWMMYRSGWATKEGQERILEIRIKRDFFEEIMSLAVPSTFSSEKYSDYAAWQEAVSNSDVRLQWDPDHDPQGKPLARRAIQLGLRGAFLKRYSDELCWIKDITDFVIHQRANISDPEKLLLPYESAYQVLRS
jgi:hypothetical protein